MSERKTGNFGVIRGGGEDRRPRQRASLRVVEPMYITPTQLQLPLFMPRPSTVISVGYEGLTLSALEEIFRLYRPRVVVDMRLAPSFYKVSLPRREVAALFERCHVQYRHIPDLANRFLGTSLDRRETLRRFADAIADSPQLHELRDLVEHGPVVLLGLRPEHLDSERDVLVNALQDLRPGFGLVRLDEPVAILESRVDEQ